MNEKVNEIPDWENPNIFSIGKTPAHSTVIPFENVNEALGKWEDSSYFKSPPTLTVKFAIICLQPSREQLHI